ncbi:MAG TPA: GNVR domain-containing protein [Candidatus Koribacter sp.]|jgi:uncharacterized protein involved in exopolysaccharide biosynthesis
MTVAVEIAEQDLELERIDLLRLATRNRKTLLLVAIAAAVGFSVMTMLLPVRYTATTRLLPPQQNQSLATLFMGQTGGTGLSSVAQKELGIKNSAYLYIGMLNSRSVRDGLIEHAGLARVYGMRGASEVRAELARRTRIQLTKEGMITVAVEDGDPQRAAVLANGYSEELRRTTQRLAMTEAAQRRQFFDDQVQQTREDLNRAETVFREVQQKTGMLQMDAQAKTLIETAAMLRAQIAAGEVQLRTLRAFGTEQNPDVRQQEAQLGGWRSELGRLESQGGDAAFSKGRAPAQAEEYVRAMRNVKYHEAVLEMLLKQLEAAKLDEAKEATVIQVVDAAVAPDARSSPKRSAIVVLGTVAALMLAMVVLWVREEYAHNTAWQQRWCELRMDWRRA